MSGQSSPPTKAQLDKSDREHLEDVVTELRDTVEADIEYQLEHAYDLDDRDGGEDLFGGKADVRSELVKAVEREDDDKSWEEKFERYVMGVGYTIVNRLTALRCMEVRGFIERPITQFGDSGTTPAAEKLENEQYLAPDEAKIEAYDEACRKLTDEIEILFDPESPYSIVDPDVSVFEELCRKLDEVPQEVWRADDVLGWVYEYYNASKLDELRRKGDREGLEPEDVPPANQFYTPHWVVRMLTDNSLAKMYLESKGELISTVEEQKSLSAGDRKYRDTSPSKTPSLADFSTYLVPTKKEGKSSSFEGPEDIRVIDPACGSGHFLLYAFDVLERIWHTERPDLNRAEIPQKILQNNLYGVDLDLRACQLAAFNLYLKARGRAEDEGATEFEMPEVGIVCADTKIASVESATEVFDEVAGEQPEVREALEDILEAFEGVQGLGSLLDVKGTLEEKFTMEEQPTIMEAIDGPGSLTNFLTNLHQEVAAHRNGDSFMAQDLRSFLRVLVILSQDYDVALMNPPYGARNRMPDTVKDYVEDHYKYTPEFYINFFEVCDRLAKVNGRIGMLVPRSFMFKRSFEDFRKDFFEERGTFDFLAEYGLGILDNATVRTVGTVVRKKGQKSKAGRFLRLHDADTEEKERVFLDTVFSEDSGEVQRLYNVDNSEFKKIPGYPISYWTPPALRQLHESEKKIDADAAGVGGDSIAKAAKGMDTGNNQRFLRSHWEVPKDDSYIPYAKGGSDAWIMPRVELTLLWGDDGSELARSDGALLKNSDFYGRDGVTWTYAKETGRRFGYFPSDGAFDGKGSMIFTNNVSNWSLISVLNSALYHGLFLSLTPERDWQVGDVGRIPWLESLEALSELKNISKEQYQLFINSRVNDPTSPYYIGPAVLPEINEFFWGNHIYAQNQDKDEIDLPSFERMSFEERTNAVIESKRERQLELHELADKADQLIFEELNIDSQTQEETLTEIQLRTSKDPKDPDLNFPESLEEAPELLGRSVKETVHHLALDSILSQDDGILPITDVSDNKESIFDIVEQRFFEIFDEVAQDRLEEVDNVLGDRTIRSSLVAVKGELTRFNPAA